MDAPKKKNTVSTFLWILLTFIFIYFLVSWFIPIRYRGIEDVSTHDLRNFLSKQMAVMYYHPQSDSCKRMMPIYKKVSNKFPSIRFLTIKADAVDEEPIASYPTFRMYNGTENIGEFTGTHDAAELEKNLKAVLETSGGKNKKNH